MARLEERRMINVANGKKEVVRNAWRARRKHRWIKAKNRIKTRRVEKRREELLLLSKTTTVVTKKRQRKKILPPLLTDFRSFLHRRIGDSCPYSRFFRGRCWWIRWPNRSYMESMAMHSCMGKLFVERQEEVIAAFKEHIRRFGREDGLLFLRDVKLYFGNYLSPGGRPAQELKKRLLGSCRQSAEEELYRFEQLIGGQRTYLGHPIPKDAPPRPDRSAVWDEVHWKWGN